MPKSQSQVSTSKLLLSPKKISPVELHSEQSIRITEFIIIPHTRNLLSNQIRNSSNPSFRRVLYKSGGIVAHHNRKIINRELDKIHYGQLHQMKNFSFIHQPSLRLLRIYFSDRLYEPQLKRLRFYRHTKLLGEV